MPVTTTKHDHHGKRNPALTLDPVCGMQVNSAKTAHHADYAGRSYDVCSTSCRGKFIADPGKYLEARAPLRAEAAAAAPGTIYTCPMHPQIRQPGPGSCPICGMALEPETPSAETGPNPEIVDFMRRFWIGLVLTLPVILLEMGGPARRLGDEDSDAEVPMAAIVVGDRLRIRLGDKVPLGRPDALAVIPAAGVPEEDVLRLAAWLERPSQHTLAEAVVRATAKRGIVVPAVEGFDAPMGRGMTGTVEGRQVAVGNARLMDEAKVDVGALLAEADRLRGDGATVFFVAVDGRAFRIVAVADPVKETTAEAVARRLGITEVEAEVLPEDKQRIIEKLKAQGRRVAMAGDGVNDAPALAAAEVRIAVGTGTAVAFESDGVTLLGGDLMGIVRARPRSQAVMGDIGQNLFFAFAYNAAGVPIAAGVMYPLFGILLSPLVAAAAMSLSSVSVVGNALRLRTTRLDQHR